MTKPPKKLRWIAPLLLAVIGGLLSLNIQVNDNAIDLLPGEAARGDLTLLQQLGLVNRVIITLSAETDKDSASLQEILKKSTRDVGRQLDSSEIFTNVVYHIPEKAAVNAFGSLRKNLPLLLTDLDLDRIDARTTEKGISESLQNVFNILNSPAGYGLKNHIRHDPLSLTTHFSQNLRHLKADYSITLEDGLFVSRDKRSTLLIAESKKQLTDANSAKEVRSRLNAIFAATLPASVTPRIIGSLPHTLANAESVQHDLKTLLPIATFLLLCLLLFSLKSPRALLVLAVPFLAAPTAIAVTAALYSEISALALGFGIVLLGIAVDFSVHLYMGLAKTAVEQRAECQRRIRKPILLATATTASVFIVVLFSDVPSHRQMATLSLTGILLAVCYSWLLVPYIAPAQSRSTSISAFGRLLRIPAPLRLMLVLIWLAVIAGGVFSWSSLKYNGNLQTLDAPNDKVRADERHFASTWGGTGDQAFIVARGATLDAALRSNYAVYRSLLEAGSTNFQSIAPLLPSLQDQQENSRNWQQFWAMKKDFAPIFSDKARQLGFSQNAFQPFFESQQTPPHPHALIDDLPEDMQILAGSMIRHNSSASTDGDSGYLVTTTVTVDDSLYTQLLELDTSSTNITLLANKKWRTQVEKLMRRDMVRLSLAAAFIITVVTIIFFRSIRAVIGVLAPVMSALAAMSIFSALTGKELNMMHLLMGIMVIGLAVDYGIFTVCTIHHKDADRSLAAITICALSSLIGFGVLSFAQHPALHSLGITVLVGIGTAWPTALLITPILLRGRKP